MDNKATYQRLQSLDALRGISVLLMVLSSSIAFGGVLPAWMYHAQVPPPAHEFKPLLAGITWVDVVFPFFLFSMGAAIPLSLNKKLQQGGSSVVVKAVAIRYVQLVLFAIFTLHARATVMSREPHAGHYWLSVAAFVVLFLMYGGWPAFFNKKLSLALKATGMVAALCFLFFYPFAYGRFDPAHSDVIILVLANMALFGSLIWMLTRRRPLLRIALLPFIAAVLVAAKVDGSINQFIYTLTPASWLYQFYYLKYLFIIIPGTIAGDWLLAYSGTKQEEYRRPLPMIAALVFGIIITNIAGLYTRHLVVNFFITLVLCGMLVYYARLCSPFFKKIVQSAVYLLLLGLFFEAAEGGIKKDFSTYSYYFVCTGLAFALLAVLYSLEKMNALQKLIHLFSLTGRNPMVAYTAGNLLLIPLMKVTGLYPVFDGLTHNAFQGFARGVLFTAAVCAITVFFTRKKIFWKT